MRETGATDSVTQGSRLFILVIRYLEHFSGGGARPPIFPHKHALLFPDFLRPGKELIQ